MLPIITVIIVSIVSVMFWDKKIDSKTMWIYGIYVVIINIICLFAMLNI